MQFKVGADPELFTRSRETGLFVSAHNMLKGTKEKPTPVKGGALQIDGTALEFNIDPALSCEEFIRNIAEVRAQMGEAVAEFNVDIVAEPVAEFDPEYFRKLPKKAVELGCNPDFNAWTLAPNPVPDAAQMFRTGSGHIHVGWGEGFDVHGDDHFMSCVGAARQMDYYVGLASLMWDPDNRRRELYGKAGAMRPKPYGFEYRVASNTWLRSEALQRFVYNATIKAMDDLVAGNDKAAQFGDLAQQLIDNNVTDWHEKYDFETGLDYSQLKEAA